MTLEILPHSSQRLKPARTPRAIAYDTRMASSPSPQGGGALIAGRYRIERNLGSGSLGSVYLALDELQRTRIALKVIRADRLTPRAAAGLGAEFQTFVALRHPQIARALDFGQLDDGGASYYTREYVSGVPLPAGPPGDASPREFLRPILDVLDALDYMHTAGVLHLDVHAGNLIVADDSRRGAVLIDFGLVRSFEELAGDVSWSLGGVLSREFLSSKTLGPSADLYMAGRLILYRLTGRASGEAKLPSEIPGWGPRLTLDLERIATKALDPSPRHRFSSARELRDALARAIGRGVRPRAVGAPAERTVGRAAELAGIDAALSRLLAGASSVVLFTGPEGIGKSRLLAETASGRGRSRRAALPTCSGSSASRGETCRRSWRRSSTLSSPLESPRMKKEMSPSTPILSMPPIARGTMVG